MLARTVGDAFRAAGLAIKVDWAARRRYERCQKKSAWRHYRDADDALRLAEELSHDGSHEGMRVYRCRYRPHYHVGHPETKARRAA